MPGAVALAVRIGFTGKLPARGDFCTRGLPSSFAEPWDAWLAEAMTGSREILGEDWLPAWLEAPVWRFTLPVGHCGPHAVAGVILPSVDKAGRHWPLMLGAVGVTPDEAWFDALEDAGMEAVLADAAPERVEAMLVSVSAPSPFALSLPSPPNGGRGLGEGGATSASFASEASVGPPSPVPLPPGRERGSEWAGEGGATSASFASEASVGPPSPVPLPPGRERGSEWAGEGGATSASSPSEAHAGPPSPVPLPPRRERGMNEAGEGTSRLATWHTLGAPRVAPRTLHLGALPSAATFAAMLQDEA